MPPVVLLTGAGADDNTYNGPPWKVVLAVMQEPFPELTFLLLNSSYASDETMPIFPDSFLGGSAPRLNFLVFSGIPFPGLPKLLLSATHLHILHLLDIPHSGYISPDVMVTALSTLTSLKSLWLVFRSPRSRPDLAGRRPPTPTRSVLPALTEFRFKGVCEYLDDLVAHIDAPRLDVLSMTFFNDIVFDTPHFIQFINRTPTLKVLEKALVVFGGHSASVELSHIHGHESFKMKIHCRELDWQVSFLEQACSSCLPLLSITEDVYMYEHPGSRLDSQDNIESTPWLELLHRFVNVNNLYLSKKFAPRIVPVLHELIQAGGRMTRVLSTLQNIFLQDLQSSGPVQEGVGRFVAARRLSGHTTTVSHWEGDLASHELW